MNREIKFRGLNANNEWVYGLPRLDLPNKTNYYNEFNYRMTWNENGAECNQPIKNGTLCQYTNLKDKNGVEVYEGDKVMFDYECTKPDEIGVITWNKDTASFQIKGHIPSSSMKHLDRMKVIGNIYENEVD